MKSCDTAVVGLGIMGASTVWDAAKFGATVLGIEAGGPTHAHGSSHGATRIYRQAYWEGENYLPLLRLADLGWRELQRTAHKRLIVETGGVFIGPRSTGVVEGSLHTAQAGNVHHESWDASTLRQRLPQFAVQDEMCAVYEPGAYVIAAEDARLHMLDEAVRLGAELRYGEVVTALESRGNRVLLTTNRGAEVDAGAVVVCAGPWTAALLPEISKHLRPIRVPIYWFRPKEGKENSFDANCFPVFLYEAEDGALLYGIPAGASSELGVKIGFHNRQHLQSDPSTPFPDLGNSLKAEISRYVEAILPDLDSQPVGGRWCFYTMSTDESFIIGSSCEKRNVHYASVCSGHGFKFATGVGAILSAMAKGEPLPVNIAPFSIERFSAVKAR